MRILFNDEPLQCAAGLTVAALLDQRGPLKPGVALAFNQQILPREQWALLQANDDERILLFPLIPGGCDVTSCS